MSLEGGPKNPEEKKPLEVPADILRKTRVVRPGSAEGKAVLNFYDAKEGGNIIHTIPYSNENRKEYTPVPKNVPPYSDEELPAVKDALRARLSTADTATRDEVEKMIEAGKSFDDFRNIEGHLDEVERAAVMEQTPVAEEPDEVEPETEEEPPVTPQVPSSTVRSRSDVARVALQSIRKVSPAQSGHEKSSAAPPPSAPLKEKPLSDRVSNVKSPFSAAPQAPEAVLPIPADEREPVPEFIRSTLRLEPRPDLEERQLTLGEILANPKQQELFGMFIDSFGADRGRLTVQKYMESQSDPASMTDIDQQWLMHFQNEFHKRSLLLKEMRTDMKPSDFEFMQKNDPSFSFLHNKVTPERATELIKLHMDRVFMRMSNEQLMRVIQANRANRDIRRSDYFREMYEAVHTKQQKLSPGTEGPDLVSIRYKTPAEREKIFDFLKPSFMQRLNSKNGLSVQRSVDTLDTIDANRIRIMQVLAATISNDTDLKREVAREVVTGISVREIGTGVLTMDQAQAESINVMEGQISDTEDLRRRIRDKEFRKKVGIRAGKLWEDMDPEEREAGSYEQMQEEGVLPKPRRGFFSLWLSSIFDAAFPDMQKKLANEFENEK